MNDLTHLSFSVFGFVSRPCAEVYEAIADPATLSRYFTTGGAEGRLIAGATVTWDFADFPGAFPVRVRQAEPSRLIVIEWEAAPGSADDGHTEVTFTLEPADDGARTKVTIAESAWRVSPDGAKAAFGNAMGWTGFLAALKVWLEHGIVLREGFYA